MSKRLHKQKWCVKRVTHAGSWMIQNELQDDSVILYSVFTISQTPTSATVIEHERNGLHSLIRVWTMLLRWATMAFLGFESPLWWGWTPVSGHKVVLWSHILWPPNSLGRIGALSNVQSGCSHLGRDPEPSSCCTSCQAVCTFLGLCMWTFLFSVDLLSRVEKVWQSHHTTEIWKAVCLSMLLKALLVAEFEPSGRGDLCSDILPFGRIYDSFR